MGGRRFKMKSLKLLVASALVAFPSRALQASPSGNFGELVKESRDFCLNVVLPLRPTASLGQCVSYSVTYGTYGYAQHECDAARELDPDFDIDFGTYANCVR